MTGDEARRAFGELVTESIQQRGFTQGRVAESLGVKQSTVSTWVLGKSIPEPGVLEELANLLELSFAHLIELKLAAMADARPRGRRTRPDLVVHDKDGRVVGVAMDGRPAKQTITLHEDDFEPDAWAVLQQIVRGRRSRPSPEPEPEGS